MYRIRNTATKIFKLVVKKIDFNSVNPPKPDLMQPQRQIDQSKSSQHIASTSRTSLDYDLYTNSSRLSRSGSSSTLEELKKRTIPVVNLKDFSSKDAEIRDQFVQTLGNSLKDYG